MSLFHRRRKPGAIAYDPATQQPAVRKSICTGEMTLGFIDRATGRFHEVMLAPDHAAVEAFCREIGVPVDSVRTIY